MGADAGGGEGGAAGTGRPGLDDPRAEVGVRGGAASRAELADAENVRLRHAAGVAVQPWFGEVEAFVAGGDDEERRG